MQVAIHYQVLFELYHLPNANLNKILMNLTCFYKVFLKSLIHQLSHLPFLFC